jgi:hypothetical protein
MSRWNYVAAAQKSTATFHSLLGKFTSSTQDNLILGCPHDFLRSCTWLDFISRKDSRIEISNTTDQGLEPVIEFNVFGAIEFMCLLRSQVYFILWNFGRLYLNLSGEESPGSVIYLHETVNFCSCFVHRIVLI